MGFVRGEKGKMMLTINFGNGDIRLQVYSCMTECLKMDTNGHRCVWFIFGMQDKMRKLMPAQLSRQST